MDKEKVRIKMNETLSPQKLAREKYDLYRDYCIDILNTIVECFEEMDFDRLDQMTFYSPAGDAYGMDNSPIDFGFDEHADVLEAMRILIHLKEIADGEAEPDSDE